MSVADRIFRERRTGWAGGFERSLRQRMSLAIAASLAFHLLFFSGFEWTEIFHVDKPEGQPLRARIAALKPVAAAEPSTKPVAPRAKPRPQPVPRLPKAAEAVLPPAPVAASREPAPVVEAPAPPVEETRPEPAKPVPEPAPETAAAEAPIAFPESIDLEFNLLKGVDGSPVGRVVHRFERHGDRYLIRSTTEASGFGALFATGKFVQESQGMITTKGLRPERFSVQRGRAERSETATFNWESAKATLSAGGNTREWDLRPGAQDLLSFMHQLSFIVGDANPPAVWVTTARRFDTVRIEVVGKAMVDTDLGPIAAVHFRNHSSDDGLRFEVWVAPDYGNLPIKIRLRDRRGEEAEQVLANMRIR